MPLVKNYPLPDNRLFRVMSVSFAFGFGAASEEACALVQSRTSPAVTPLIPKFLCPNSDLFRHFLYLFEIL